MRHTPIREALARLHADGLAEFSANRGYRVAAAPDAAAYGHWMEARIAIEVSALRLATMPLDPALIRRLEAANRAIEQVRPGLSAHAETRFFAEANLEFHAALVEASGNPFLLRAWRQVAQTAQFSRTHLRAGSVQGRSAILREHGAVLAALRRSAVEEAAEVLRAPITDSLGRDRLLAAPAQDRKRTGEHP
jgi:DNA-binding GntR family transcriptional regulator